VAAAPISGGKYCVIRNTFINIIYIVRGFEGAERQKSNPFWDDWLN
jgi:hypothetical protein